MQEVVALRFKNYLNETINKYSNPHRECNYEENTFHLESWEDVFCTGEFNVEVILTKDSGLKALFSFVYRPAKSYWDHIVLTSQHTMTDEQKKLYQLVEQHNLRYRGGILWK